MGQLAEVMLYATHSYGSKECVLFGKEQQQQQQHPQLLLHQDIPNLNNTIDSLTTSLALSTRSLELLRTAYERRSRGGHSVSHSQSGQSGQSGQPPLHGSATQSPHNMDGSVDVYETAMQNQIQHYAAVTLSASKQLEAVLSINCQDPKDVAVTNWRVRSEHAIHSAVMSMARRAAGLQALTSTCTSSRDARMHSSSHAQSLYEHSLCLLEDLLANSFQESIQQQQQQQQQQPPNGGDQNNKFLYFASLAETITKRLHELPSR